VAGRWLERMGTSPSTDCGSQHLADGRASGFGSSTAPHHLQTTRPCAQSGLARDDAFAGGARQTFSIVHSATHVIVCKCVTGCHVWQAVEWSKSPGGGQVFFAPHLRFRFDCAEIAAQHLRSLLLVYAVSLSCVPRQTACGVLHTFRVASSNTPV
jgi:hypothetical protein